MHTDLSGRWWDERLGDSENSRHRIPCPYTYICTKLRGNLTAVLAGEEGTFCDLYKNPNRVGCPGGVQLLAASDGASLSSYKNSRGWGWTDTWWHGTHELRDLKGNFLYIIWLFSLVHLGSEFLYFAMFLFTNWEKSLIFSFSELLPSLE